MYGVSLVRKCVCASVVVVGNITSASISGNAGDVQVLCAILATILVGWMAEILVHSIDSAANELKMPTLFIGVILLPFFGNAAEHFTAVIVAGKDKMDLSLAIAIGSSVQIAVFVAPLMVVFAWAMGVDLSLEFGPLETAATFLSVLVANSILRDGTTNWLEGAMLLACYTILGLSFWMM